MSEAHPRKTVVQPVGRRRRLHSAPCTLAACADVFLGCAKHMVSIFIFFTAPVPE